LIRWKQANGIKVVLSAGLKRVAVLVILCILVLAACRESGFDGSAAVSDLDELMQNLVLARDQGGAGLQNPVVAVMIPDERFEYEFASGRALAWTEGPMTTAHQFHTASVSKTFTATLILQLAEEGQLGPNGLDASLGELGVFDDAILDRLHIVDGVSFGSQITIRQLLLHSSGLKDQFGDDANGTESDYGGKPAPGGLISLLQHDVPAHMASRQDPDCDGNGLITRKRWKHWDPERPDDPMAGMLNFYINQMAQAGVCEPGSCYHYSDIGYVILALTAEKISGKSLHGLLRERIFDPLGMNSSYLAYGVNPDSSAWEYRPSDFDLSGIPAVSAGINLSFDWGGGGVVATAAELNRYFRALLEGQLFSDPQTLAEMLDWQVIPGMEENKTGIGLGLFRMRGPDGQDFWVKYGAWGSGMLFDPEAGSYVSGTTNVLFGPRDWWTKIVVVLREARSQTIEGE